MTTLVSPATPVLQHLSALNISLGDHCNRRTLADKLRDIIRKLPGQVTADASLSMAKARDLMQEMLASHFKSTTMYVCEDSSYLPLQSLPASRLSSLDAYLLGCGIPVPKTLEALVNLEHVVSRQAQIHPLGNLSGALSWPLAIPERDQSSIISLMQSNTSGLPDLPLADSAKGALGYLLSGSSVSETDLKTPVAAMEKLLGSPKAQALGRAIQTRLGGIPIDGAGIDYVMTAIQLGLDPQTRTASTPTTVAGFDPAQSQHGGQPASVVIDGLAEHLVKNDRVSQQTANLGAYLLLARMAPEYLVKDIPASVTYGSVPWAQLAMAVARIESQTPGRTLAMEYAQILLTAETLDIDAAVSHKIDYQALRDWGCVNGVLATAEETPSVNDMESVRAAYNRHLSALKTNSTLLQTPIPRREVMARAQLEEAFAELDTKLFSVLHLQKVRLKSGRPGAYPGMRSMLDIVMEGDPLGAEDHWITQDKRIPIDRFCSLYAAGKLGVATSFKEAYDLAIKAHEEGHQGAVCNLIFTLPLEDRMNLAFGSLEFFHTNQYKIAIDLLSPPALHVRGHTLEVKTRRNGQVNLYLIDTRRGTIEKQNWLLGSRTEPYTADKLETRAANIFSRTVLFEPDKDKYAVQFQEQPADPSSTDSFNSMRSHAIADVFVKSLDLKNDDLLNESRGITSYDQERARNEAISEFFLNLIPLRSAIVNFQKGNIGQGLFDLSLDVVGLVTLGAGKAAQATKVLGKAVSTASHAVKATRFVGATVVEALNPLSGVGDLVVAGGRLAVSGGRYAAVTAARQLNQLRGSAGSYDLLKAASKAHGEAATGIFKLADESVEGGAVWHRGKWYALDAQTMRPYGRPLENFAPAARALDGKITHLPAVSNGELSNALFREFKVPESTITKLSPNSQGVYVAADGHLSHIRHTDRTGQTAIYEVRQITRTADGNVQARVYHNNRQTSLLVQHIEGNQWQRLGLFGGNPPSIKSDLGPEIGRGGEGVVYASLDGKRAYKDFGPTTQTPADVSELSEVEYLNKYYGDGFARTAVDDGRLYLVMGRIDGVDLGQIKRGSLPPEARSLLADVFVQMEAKNIYHNDMQLKNYLYSATDNKVYPVDLDAMQSEWMPPFLMDMYQRNKQKVLGEYAALMVKAH